jgi:hypothetical protein
MRTMFSESIDHLPLGCVFSGEVWFKNLRRYCWQGHAPTPDEKFADWWITSRKAIPKAMQKAFNSLVALVASCIWLQPNTKVFTF